MTPAFTARWDAVRTPDWPALRRELIRWLAELAHQEAGRWRPQRVRVDVPDHLVRAGMAPRASSAALVADLAAQGICAQVLACRRDDVFLQVW